MAETKQRRGKGILAEYFPMIQAREEVQKKIAGNSKLNDIFQQWNEKTQSEFLDFCSGEKGIKVVYDGIFKEVFNPEVTPERLEALLSLILGFEVKIEKVLPNDGVRLGAESSLLYTDIVVQHTDGSLSDVEIQKIGYDFPGERSACYSAAHLLRQYKKVRGESESSRHFNYRDLKSVYTIVFFERSPELFKKFPDKYLHRFRQQSDTGLEIELVQKYYFLSLDIFKENMDNKPIENEFEAWLSFLSYDDPERILELITAYPRFKAMYQDIYEICRNMEEVMSVFSKELMKMDQNTVQYMLETRQKELEHAKKKMGQLEEDRKQAEEKAEKEAKERELAEERRKQAEEKAEKEAKERKQAEEKAEKEAKERKLAEAKAEQFNTELKKALEELEKLKNKK